MLGRTTHFEIDEGWDGSFTVSRHVMFLVRPAAAVAAVALAAGIVGWSATADRPDAHRWGAVNPQPRLTVERAPPVSRFRRHHESRRNRSVAHSRSRRHRAPSIRPVVRATPPVPPAATVPPSSNGGPGEFF
jgi:hypothetical protein